MTKVHSGGQYRPLTREQVEQIHQASLTILSETGFTFESGLDRTLEMLAGAGAELDLEGGRIRFPRELVEAKVDLAPSRITLFSRDGRSDLELGGDRVFLGTGGSTTTILDLESGRSRPSKLKDVYDIGRLVDHLENIDFYLRPCFPTDLLPEEYDHNCLFACLAGTFKHVMAGQTSLEGFRTCLEMARLVAGGDEEFRARPFWSTITCFAISPLKLCTTSTLIMQAANRAGVPVAMSSAPMAGSTSPLTMAGTLALVHAEELAGLVISQTTAPGAPVLYGGIPGMADLRTMGYKGGSAEFGMMNAAVHQLAARVKVPNYNSSGLTDSKLPDAQAGWEKGMTTLLAAMGGSNYIHHAAGMLESMLGLAYEQYVIDDEIIGQSKRVLDGIRVDEETLGLAAIDRVGPGGNFIMSPHTFSHMRTEYFQGNGVSDRRNRDSWEKSGSLSARDRAREIAARILEKDDRARLEEGLVAELRERFTIRLEPGS